jgi:hypothetical protein
VRNGVVCNAELRKLGFLKFMSVACAADKGQFPPVDGPADSLLASFHVCLLKDLFDPIIARSAALQTLGQNAGMEKTSAEQNKKGR